MSWTVSDAIISAGVADHLAGLLLALPQEHQGSEYLIDALTEILTRPSDLTAVDPSSLVHLLDERLKSAELHQVRQFYLKSYR